MNSCKEHCGSRRTTSLGFRVCLWKEKGIQWGLNTLIIRIHLTPFGYPFIMMQIYRLFPFSQIFVKKLGVVSPWNSSCSFRWFWTHQRCRFKASLTCNHCDQYFSLRCLERLHQRGYWSLHLQSFGMSLAMLESVGINVWQSIRYLWWPYRVNIVFVT